MFGSLLPALTTSVPGPRSVALAEALARSECPALTARRARRAEPSGAAQDPISWHAARGANVRDVDGNVFVDLTGGFGAALFAHAHPPVLEAVSVQQSRLLHALGDVHPSDTKVALLEELTQLVPWSARAMLGLSGADAVEAAIKTAALASGKPGLVAFDGGYHGLSHGPLAACGYGENFREPFAMQLNPHVAFARFPESEGERALALASVEQAAGRLSGRAGALLIEPIQGRGGVRVPPAGFLHEVCALARRLGLLVIVDEIYTGLGRAGALLSHLEAGAEADLVCLGKGLGGGIPISACIGRAEVMAAWGDPRGEALHTSTFLGNPPGCAAALATLAEVRAHDAPARARERGEALREALRGVAGVQVRGAGLMLGLSVGASQQLLSLQRALLARGYISLPAGAPPAVLCLTPPLCLSDAQIQGFAAALAACLKELA